MRKHSALITGLSLLTAAVISLTGCTNSSETAPSSNDDQSNESTVETMFGPIDIPQNDGGLRVVALGWSDAEAALALGVKPVGVYDWMNFGDDNHGVGPWAAKLFDKEQPVVMSSPDYTFDYEKIESLKPDVILNVNSGGDKEQFERLNSIAPTVFAPKGITPFGVGWKQQTLTISQAFGNPEKGQELVDEVQQRIDTAAKEHPEFGDLTAVTGIKVGDSYGAYLAGDLRRDLLDQLGFHQSPRIDELGPQTTFAATISAEQVSALDADVAVLFPLGYSLKELTSDPLISALPVVKDGRAILLSGDDEVTNAFSAGSVLSVPVALDRLLPLMAEAAKKATQQ